MLNVQPIPAFAPSGALALAVTTEQLHTSCVTMHPSTLITRSTVFAELVSHCPRALHPRRLQATLLDYLQPPIEHAIVAACHRQLHGTPALHCIPFVYVSHTEHPALWLAAAVLTCDPAAHRGLCPCCSIQCCMNPAVPVQLCSHKCCACTTCVLHSHETAGTRRSCEATRNPR